MIPLGQSSRELAVAARLELTSQQTSLPGHLIKEPWDALSVLPLKPDAFDFKLGTNRQSLAPPRDQDRAISSCFPGDDNRSWTLITDKKIKNVIIGAV